MRDDKDRVGERGTLDVSNQRIASARDEELAEGVERFRAGLVALYLGRRERGRDEVGSPIAHRPDWSRSTARRRHAATHGAFPPRRRRLRSRSIFLRFGIRAVGGELRSFG